MENLGFFSSAARVTGDGGGRLGRGRSGDSGRSRRRRSRRQGAARHGDVDHVLGVLDLVLHRWRSVDGVAVMNGYRRVEHECVVLAADTTGEGIREVRVHKGKQDDQEWAALAHHGSRK